MIQITDNTKLLISELNNKLKENCPDLQISILPHGKDTFKLCILNNNVCVSYLIITDDNNTFNIISETDKEYQGKGYNKFLTAVSICLADTMTNCRELVSSTYVEARIHILSEYEHTLEKDKEDDYSNFFVPIYKNNFFVPIYENKNKAEEIMSKWINNKCVKANVGGKKIRRNKQRRKSQKRKASRRKSKIRKSKKRKTKRKRN